MTDGRIVVGIVNNTPVAPINPTVDSSARITTISGRMTPVIRRNSTNRKTAIDNTAKPMKVPMSCCIIRSKNS